MSCLYVIYHTEENMGCECKTKKLGDKYFCSKNSGSNLVVVLSFASLLTSILTLMHMSVHQNSFSPKQLSPECFTLVSHVMVSQNMAVKGSSCKSHFSTCKSACVARPHLTIRLWQCLSFLQRRCFNSSLCIRKLRITFRL
ncbi:hypothetical protein AMECASPLE_037012 [Ameca splendens]|uniref:Uncharacterized protein n=1 Tax=Ameca splendens TaxID=208324 RepID=A0ABV0YIX1_9TELE